jgi:competence protein ComEA
MSTLHNYPGSCSMFNAMNRCTQRGVLRSLCSGVVALMLCHSALALDINQANEAELDSVKGMGPALSAKVLKARSQGAFKDWQDLMQRVSGVRQNKAWQLSEQGLTVNGQAFSTKP